MAGEFFNNLNRLGTYTGTGTYGAANELPDGANVSLFKVLYGPEVLANFRANLVFGKATRVKSITQGKGYEFNLLADVSAKYHYPGDTVSGQQILRGTRQIFLDGILESDVYVHKLDELLNHTDERKRYASEMGYALAVKYDKGISAEIIRGALVEPISGVNADIAKGGTIIEKAISGATDQAIALLETILELGKELDKKNVPRNGRIIVLKPDYYWALFTNLDLINTLHPGIGSLAQGDVMRIAGFTIMTSNLIPTDASEVEKHEIPSQFQADGVTASSYANIATNAVIGSNTVKYRRFNKENDVAKIAGLFFRPEAIVTLKRQGLTIDTEEHKDKFSTLILAYMLVGHGWLNPVNCGTIIDNDPASSVIVASA